MDAGLALCCHAPLPLHRSPMKCSGREKRLMLSIEQPLPRHDFSEAHTSLPAQQTLLRRGPQQDSCRATAGAHGWKVAREPEPREERVDCLKAMERLVMIEVPVSDPAHHCDEEQSSPSRDPDPLILSWRFGVLSPTPDARCPRSPETAFAAGLKVASGHRGVPRAVGEGPPISADLRSPAPRLWMSRLFAQAAIRRAHLPRLATIHANATHVREESASFLGARHERIVGP